MKYLILTLLISLVGNNTHSQNRKLDQLKWLQGTWIMATDGVQFVECWQAITNTLWQGMGLATNIKGDTLFNEDLQIAVQNDTVWYLPTIANQNEGKQVKFAATELTDKKAVFENKQHNFPQRIVYTKTSDSTIYAYVEGIQKGNTRKEEFHFKRK